MYVETGAVGAAGHEIRHALHQGISSTGCSSSRAILGAKKPGESLAFKLGRNVTSGIPRLGEWNVGTGGVGLLWNET